MDSEYTGKTTYITIEDKTRTAEWKAQLLAEAAGTEVETEDNCEEEEEEAEGVTKYMSTTEALVQVSHTTDACCHLQKTQLMEHLQIFRLKLPITGCYWLVKALSRIYKFVLCINRLIITNVADILHINS